MQGAWVRSLVGEPRSHLPYIVAKKKKERERNSTARRVSAPQAPSPPIQPQREFGLMHKERDGRRGTHSEKERNLARAENVSIILISSFHSGGNWGRRAVKRPPKVARSLADMLWADSRASDAQSHRLLSASASHTWTCHRTTCRPCPAAGSDPAGLGRGWGSAFLVSAQRMPVLLARGPHIE